MKLLLSRVLKSLAVLTLLLSVVASRAGVVINEFMYQPASFNTNDEWIELWNNSTNTVDLAGWAFTKGINFTFTNSTPLAPGDYLVVAARSNVFAANPIYPNYASMAAAGKVRGDWTGTLKNSGDTIRLEDALGNKVDEIHYATEGDWAIRKRGELDNSHRGWEWTTPHDGTGKTLELVNPNILRDSGQNWAAGTLFGGTPGAPNSVFNTNSVALILGTTHYPPVPASTNSVAITARIVDPNGTNTTVRLFWRLDANPQNSPFTPTTMFDDGAHGDGIAGDAVYGAILPPQTNTAIVEFYVEAVTIAGKTNSWPAPAIAALDGTGPTGHVANALFQFDDSVANSSQPVLRLIMTQVEKAERDTIASIHPQSDAQMNATLITTSGSGRDARYLCGVRERGAGSRGAIPPNHRINVPNDNKWHGLSQFNLNSQFTHSQVAGYALATRAGLDTEFARAVQLRINAGNPANSGLRQYGSYVQLETIGSEFVDVHFPLDNGGNIYRASSGPHTATLNYLGTDPASYIAAGYSKNNNTSENDWSDLIQLTSVLTNAPDANYAASVRQVADVEQWMLYFAVFSFIDSEETSLATGAGDDYTLYRGSIDPRFKIIGHDFDTILGQGDTPGVFTTNIFRMVPAVNGRASGINNNTVALNRFMTNAEFAPIYYAQLKQLIDGAFSNTEVSHLLDEQLGSWVPASVITSMKTFATNRNAYIRSVIPTTVTATSSLSIVSGFPQTSVPMVTLFGQSDPIRTRTVLVNGSTSSWTAWSAKWTNTISGLQPGINRVLVQALDTNGVEFARTNYDVWLNTGGVSVSGTLTSNATWTAAGGPYNITAALTVPSGRVLTIQPGATLFISPGVSITVNGQLLAQGNDTSRIRFTAVPGSASWGSLDFINTGTVESKIAYADFDSCGAVNIGGHTAQLHVNASRIFVDHCTWANTPAQQYISFDASSFIVQSSVFPTYPWATSAPEMLHGVNGIQANGYGIFRDNYFGHTYGFNDTIDFTGGQRPGPILQIIGNVFDGAGDDHLDLDSTDAWIEGNIFMHAHRDPNRTDDPLDTASAISGGVDVAGQYSEWTIVNNLFYDMDHAVLVKQGNRFTFVNNTLVHIAKENGSGLTNDIAAFNFTDKGLAAPDPAIGAGGYIANNIIWDLPALTANYVAPNNTVIFESNLMQFAWSGPGSNNIVADPRLNLQLINSITNADWQTVKAALAPRAGSLAFGNGWGAKYDKGGLNPRGLMIVGEPSAITTNTSATLRVLPGGTFSWGTNAYLWGYTHYKWKLDNGAWSAETPITSQPTISLSGLAAGAHTVYVVGKNDAGYYQDDTFVYPTNGVNVGSVALTPAAHLTASRTWVVTNSIPGRVILSELLAFNAGGVETNGSSPDLIEIYNPGTTAYDLSGVGITDDATNKYKYFFPPGTTLAPGQYLVLLADSDKNSPGIHLGFSLNQSGESVFVYDSSTRGGALLDSVTFGVQLPNLSIARVLPDTNWGLATPTLGAPNARVDCGVAEPGRVFINEWLTAQSFGDDFVELFNTDPAPVDLGGGYMTDVPAVPIAFAIHQFPPLTFMPANGFLVLHADGNTDAGADHLSFKLSADRGQIALYSSAFAMIDQVLYGPQFTDVSEGRSPDAGGDQQFFTTPTPGSPNPGSGNVLINVSNVFVNVFGVDNKSWKFNTNKVDLGTAWRAAGYDDSAWASGFGLFGRETTPAQYLPFTFQTPIAAPQSNGPTCSYFRTHFTWTNGNDWSFVLTNYVDDGAVFYLNGQEFGRIRITADPVFFTNFAQNATEPVTAVLSFPATNLVNGDNVIAVELHQSDAGSSDDVFGMSLALTKSFTNTTVISVALNEVMANNKTFTNADGTITDWLEIYNPSAATVNLSDMSLTDDPGVPRRWVFPPGVTVASGGYLIVKFDGGAPASTNYNPPSTILNTGFGFSAGGDAVLLFDKLARGGSLLDSVAFGIQAPDFTIARVPNAAGAWTLGLPTEGSANIAASLGNGSALRINEWMADPRSGEDWFEVFNPNAQPVAMGGLYLTDTLTNRTQYRIPNLSFIGTGLRGFVQFVADSTPSAGADHVNFKLSAGGESIGLFAADGVSVIDAITFGAQAKGVSEGRFPDGATNIVKFPETPTPGNANFLPFNDIYINEALTHTDLPLEDAIELFNPTATPINIGGWYLSDSKSQPKRFRIADNTIVQAGGFVLFFENQFNDTNGNPAGAFALSSGNGDNIHLSVADAAGNLTGYRVAEDFGAQANGVSFGKFETSIGYDFVAMSNRTFGVDSPASVQEFRTSAGATNSYAKVGPVVITEIHYHPPDVAIGGGAATNDNTAEEFIELYNSASTNVALFYPGAATNTWHLRNAVEFDFPTNVTMAARSYLLVVGFDPSTNATTTAAFRTKYGIGAGVPIYGPLSGKLANDDDNVELRKPDEPNANDVPYVLVEKVHYRDSAPWPSAADWNTNGTTGISLQRVAPLTYANEPTNWVAGVPTAGATNGAAFGTRPNFLIHPASRSVAMGSNVVFTAGASGGAPITYQWRFNGIDILGATNTGFTASNAQFASVGRYSVRAMNPFGVAVSSNAFLALTNPPEIVFQPQSVSAQVGNTVVFTVGARGTQPLAYQWRKDGTNVGGATKTSLVLTNVQLSDAGNYTVVITNSFGSVTSAVAFLVFNTAPIITQQPQSTNVFVGETATFNVTAVGSQPIRYQWRFNGANIGGATNFIYGITNAQVGNAGGYSVLVSNAFGSLISSTATLAVVTPPTVRVVATDANASEVGSDPGQFTISRSGTTNIGTTVAFTISGTAQSGSDYTAIPNSVFMAPGVTSVVVNVTPINDSAPEAQETVVLTINSSSQYVIGSPGNATVTILDDDNQLPSVTVTAPANGAVYPVSPTNIQLTATASDPDGGVARVDFFSNGSNYIGQASGSGTYNLLWVNALPGTNIITAVATDIYGATKTSTGVSIYVNAAPTVAITTPGDFSSVPQGDVQIVAQANDPGGNVTRVDFYFTNTFVRSVSNAPYNITISNLQLGSYSTYAVALDDFGLKATSAVVNFTVVSSQTNLSDMFTNRGFITGVTNFATTNNAAASAETGEQEHVAGNPAQRSMWISWTAPALGAVVIDTFGSSFDTVLAVYTNRPSFAPTVANIIAVTNNDDADGFPLVQSRVVFSNLVAGTLYHIAVDGYSGATGTIALHISMSNTVPYISKHPSSVTNTPGQLATFTVNASGADTLSYRWLFNGVPLAGVNFGGTNSSTLYVTNSQAASAGSYRVVVSNSYGAVTSAVATLTIQTPIGGTNFTIRPVSRTTNVFTAVLIGTPTNRGYSIEVTTNFTEGWVPLKTVSNINGSVQWSDTNAAPRRNYRARLLP